MFRAPPPASQALRTAAGMAKSQVPLFLLCGGLLESPLNTPTEMSRVLYDMQLACINTQVRVRVCVCCLGREGATRPGSGSCRRASKGPGGLGRGAGVSSCCVLSAAVSIFSPQPESVASASLNLNLTHIPTRFPPVHPQAPMQPVHAVELYPMPQARVEGGASGVAPASEAGDDDIGDGAGPRELRPLPPAARLGGADDGMTEVSVEEAAALGSNIFALLVVGAGGRGRWGPSAWELEHAGCQDRVLNTSSSPRLCRQGYGILFVGYDNRNIA